MRSCVVYYPKTPYIICPLGTVKIKLRRGAKKLYITVFIIVAVKCLWVIGLVYYS